MVCASPGACNSLLFRKYRVFLKFESHYCVRPMPGYFTEKYFVAFAILFHSSNLRVWLPFRLSLAASVSVGIVPVCWPVTAVKCCYNLRRLLTFQYPQPPKCLFLFPRQHCSWDEDITKFNRMLDTFSQPKHTTRPTPYLLPPHLKLESNLANKY